jgi:hypothetical protein
LRAAGVWLPPYSPPPPHPLVESGTDPPPVIDVTMQWEVDSGHRYVRLPDGGRLYRVCLDHSLAPHDYARPHPEPQPPWTPCHLVDWSPPTRRTADTTTPSTATDSSAPEKKNRPYFLAELADLTIAPDIYNCNDDDHNLMEYEVSLGTQQLLTTELLKRGRVTLATTHPIAIPRWFAPGHASTEAAEHAVITQAQHRRTAQRDHIDHPLWITSTSPATPPPPTAPASTQPFVSLFWFLICLCMSLPLEPLHGP